MTGSLTTSFSFPRRYADELGVPSAALAALVERLEAQGLDPHALLIARGGQVAFEAAWAPYRLDRPALVYSASKTFTSLAIGFLVDEGRLALDDDAAAVLDEPGGGGITVRHLLTMNTGHSAAQLAALDDDWGALLATAPEQAPGTHFAYNSPATFTLSRIVTAVTGERLTAYLRPRLLDPLGIAERFMTPVGGVDMGASGFHLTVEDLARTATMLGAGGVFDGVQVVPAWYVEQLSQPWSRTAEFDGPVSEAGEVNDWALGYGYQVWRGREGFRLDGAAGQFALVLPERDLVIAYQGATLETQAVLRAFWAFVDAVGAVDAAGGAAGDPAPRPNAQRDSWDARASFDIMTEAPFDVAGLALVDAAEGWTLTLPGVGDLPVGTSWCAATVRKQAEPTTRVVPAAVRTTDQGATDRAAHVSPDRLALATRGEVRADGSVAVHVVDTTSPHRAIVLRGADGALRAGWHIPPLGGGWELLGVPAFVTQATTRAAALLLDMDGTLVDSHAVVERLWTQWSRDHGVDPARTLAIIHGRQGQDSMALLLPERPHEVNLAENRELLALETAQTEGVVAIAGAARLLDDLVGLPHALVTSATRALAVARLGAAGLRMPHIAVTAEDVARSKPDPEGFLAAAHALGVDPADCIVVEDSANGIAAGRAAGMRVIGVGAHAEGATWRVADASGIQVASAPSPGQGGPIVVTIDD